MPRYAQTVAAPELIIEPEPAPSETVLKLRRDVRMAAVSQFINLFKRHVNLQFEITDLEHDLDSVGPYRCIPAVLGKLVNTLANDRNTNASNWLPGLRRAYNRRMINREDHPFFRWERVRIDKEAVAAEAAAQAAAAAAAEGGAEAQPMDVDPALKPASVVEPLEDPQQGTSDATPAGEDLKPALDDLAPALAPPQLASNLSSDAIVPAEPTVASSEAKQELEPMQVDAPERERELDAPKVDPAEGEESKEDGAEPEDDWGELGVDYYEDRIEIPWEDVDLDTRIQAIYNLCEWHMQEPERFRRHFKFPEDETIWRVAPIGRDAPGNKYYFFDDHRLWIHRAPPPAPPKVKTDNSPPTQPIIPSSPARDQPTEDAEKPVVQEETPAEVEPQVDVEAVAELEPEPEPSVEEAPVPVVEAPETSRKKRTRSPTPPAPTPPAVDAVEDSEPEPEPVEEARERSRSVSSEPVKKRARTTRNRPAPPPEEWEEIPDDLRDEWTGASKSRGRRGSGGSSVLTSLGDEDEFRPDESDEDDEYNPEEELSQADDAEVDEEEEVDETGDFDAVLEGEELADGERDTRMKWEREYWAERDRIDGLEDFVEWEAICVTLEEWEAFGTQFVDTRHRFEKQLRNLVHSDILPAVTESLKAREQARIADIQAMHRKRSSRLAFAESEADEKARVAAEASKYSRASRHQVKTNTYDEVLGSDSGSVPPTGNTAAAGKGPALQAALAESREDRLRKREEERIAREQAIIDAQIEEAKQAERAAAIAANGGVVPPGMETEEELAAIRAEKEKAEQKPVKPEVKKPKAGEKRSHKKATPAKVAPPPPPPAPVGVSEEPPWLMDCNVCGLVGWNLDDGTEIIGCDRCSEWQHIACLVADNAKKGRPPVNYSDESLSYVCARCTAHPTRKPRTPPARLPPPALAAAAAPLKEKPKPKSRAAPKDRKAAPGTPKAAVEARKTRPIPKARGNASSAHANGHAAAAPTGIPGPGQPPLSYDALKALIETNPFLVNQLPPTYQQHFGQLLGIPIPYPTTGVAPSSVSTAPAAVTATPTASTGAVGGQGVAAAPASTLSANGPSGSA